MADVNKSLVDVIKSLSAPRQQTVYREKSSVPWVPIFIVGGTGALALFIYLKSKGPKLVDGGWLPCLTSVVNVTAPFTPSSGTWLPCLTSVVNVTAPFTPSSGTWLPCLASIVDISAVVTPSSGTWLPCLSSIMGVTATSQNIPVGIITFQKNPIQQGEVLWYAVSGFAPNQQVTVSCNGYAVVFTTDSQGNYSSNFPPTSSFAPGTYTLQAAVAFGTSVTADFTIVKNVTLNITADSSLGFVETLVGGVEISPTGQVHAGTTVVVNAYAWNSNAAKFDSWIDPNYILSNTQRKSPSISIQANDDVTLMATFVAISPPPPPPPPSGPTFPAPGTVGDGGYWYWATGMNGTGWVSFQELSSNPGNYVIISGPYASGATG